MTDRNSPEQTSTLRIITVILAISILVTAAFFLAGPGVLDSTSGQEEFVPELEAQIELWREDLARLRAEIETSEDLDLAEEINALEGQIDELALLIEDLEASSEEAWEDLQPRIEQLLRDIQRAFQDLAKQLPTKLPVLVSA